MLVSVLPVGHSHGQEVIVVVPTISLVSRLNRSWSAAGIFRLPAMKITAIV